MSCANQTYASQFVIAAPPSGWRKLWRVIVMLAEAFHEALAMRRAAFRMRPMLDE